MPSSEWKYFIDNFFANQMIMWDRGIDPTVANDLKGDERNKGEDMLIESLRKGCHWAPMGLREMGSKKAIPVMKELIDSSHYQLQLEIAYALNVLEKTTDYLPYLIEILKNAGSWDRMTAARMLRNYNTPEVIEALYGSIEDSDHLVRNHSCESLLNIHGLAYSLSENAEYKEIHEKILAYYDVEDDEKRQEACEQYKRAAEMLRELIDTKTN
jgi:HEAT repeat protein